MPVLTFSSLLGFQNRKFGGGAVAQFARKLLFCEVGDTEPTRNCPASRQALRFGRWILSAVLGGLDVLLPGGGCSPWLGQRWLGVCREHSLELRESFPSPMEGGDVGQRQHGMAEGWKQGFELHSLDLVMKLPQREAEYFSELALTWQQWNCHRSVRHQGWGPVWPNPVCVQPSPHWWMEESIQRNPSMSSTVRLCGPVWNITLVAVWDGMIFYQKKRRRLIAKQWYFVICLPEMEEFRHSGLSAGLSKFGCVCRLCIWESTLHHLIAFFNRYFLFFLGSVCELSVRDLRCCVH